MKEYIDFVNANQNYLRNHAIIFNQQAALLRIEEHYSEIIFQEQALSKEQHEIIQNLRQEHQQKRRAEKAKIEENANNEEEIHKKREEEFHKKISQQRQAQRTQESASPAGPLGSQNHQIGNLIINLETPLNKLPDSPMKYARIIEEFKQTQRKFTDDSFVAGNGLLSQSMAKQVYKWRRPNLAATLFIDSISPLDIKQGAIGDCYLMSAMGVAGKKRIEDVFLYHEPAFDPAARDKCGAYILKFWKNNSWIYVIVDDLLPYGLNDKLVLGQSEDENELWPAIIEKAYAKLYGNYEVIERGKVSYALQDLTGGFPEELILDNFEGNLEVFWSKIMDFKKQGCILGAGSPTPPHGRNFITNNGIVLGHAYAILDCKEIDKNKLICLRNPHGKHGKEWLGDWSDKSPKWNARLMKLAGEKTFEEDGKFWMAAIDFVDEFQAMYVCRIFPPEKWLEMPAIKGAWKGAKAAGMLTNPRSNKLVNNPHYGIRVTKKAEAFISLSIDESTKRNFGNFPILFVVEKNGGKRITRLQKENFVGGQRAPSAMKHLTDSVTLEAPYYPYVFSMMCSTLLEQQESSFTVQIFCTDKSAIIIDDLQFDV